MGILTFNEWAVYIHNELERTKQELYEREHRTIQRSDIKFAENGETRVRDKGKEKIPSIVSSQKTT